MIVAQNIIGLRFVERDGKRILQQARDARLENGAAVLVWEDVPLGVETP